MNKKNASISIIKKSLIQKTALCGVLAIGFGAAYFNTPLSADLIKDTDKKTETKTEEQSPKSIEDICKSLPSSAKYTEEMSFEEALMLAYKRNPTLRSARAQLRSADVGVDIARGGYYPNFVMNASLNTNASSANNQPISDAFTDLFKEFNDGQITFTLSQNLFNGFRTTNAVEAAKLQVCATRAELHNIEQQIMQATINAYLDVLLNQSILDLQDNNVQVLERQLEATNARFAVGEITRTDVAQASAALARALAERTQAKGNLEAAKSVLESTIGHPAGYLVMPEIENDYDKDTTADSAKCVAVASNPQMEAARCQYYVRLKQVEIQCGDLLPELTLQAQAILPFQDFKLGSAPDLFGNATNAQSVVSINLSVPIFRNDGDGTTYSKIRQARETAAVAYAQYEETMRRVEDEAARAYENMITTKSQIESLEIQVESEEIALEGVREEANVGTRTILDVLEAEQRYLNAKVQLERAKSDHYKAKYQLDAALGALTATDLQLPVSLYDYKKYYDRAQHDVLGDCEDCDNRSYHNHRKERGFYESETSIYDEKTDSDE